MNINAITFCKPYSPVFFAGKRGAVTLDDLLNNSNMTPEAKKRIQEQISVYKNIDEKKIEPNIADRVTAEKLISNIRKQMALIEKDLQKLEALKFDKKQEEVSYQKTQKSVDSKELFKNEINKKSKAYYLYMSVLDDKDCKREIVSDMLENMNKVRPSERADVLEKMLDYCAKNIDTDTFYNVLNYCKKNNRKEYNSKRIITERLYQKIKDVSLAAEAAGYGADNFAYFNTEDKKKIINLLKEKGKSERLKTMLSENREDYCSELLNAYVDVCIRKNEFEMKYLYQIVNPFGGFMQYMRKDEQAEIKKKLSDALKDYKAKDKNEESYLESIKNKL